MLTVIVTVSNGAKRGDNQGQLRKKLNSVYLRTGYLCHTGSAPFLLDADSTFTLDTDDRDGMRLFPIFILSAVLITTHTE